MKLFLPFVFIAFLFTQCNVIARLTPRKIEEVERCLNCVVLTEQSKNRIVILHLTYKQFIWQWKAENSNIKPEHVKWFVNPSEAKPVYDRKYVLITASGGGVALIRLADKKAVFYAYAGGNPHSAEILPDGNIVVASSTGNYLTLFKTDTTVAPDKVYYKRQFIEFGHNVVWDKENEVLWSAAMSSLKMFNYNNNSSDPNLVMVDSIPIPGTEAHDLYPVFNLDMLWITNTTKVYMYDVKHKRLLLGPEPGAHVKSISSGPAGVATIISRPKEKWWTDELIDENGKRIYKRAGLKIYKARWWFPNYFSYPNHDHVPR